MTLELWAENFTPFARQRFKSSRKNYSTVKKIFGVKKFLLVVSYDRKKL